MAVVMFITSTTGRADVQRLDAVPDGPDGVGVRRRRIRRLPVAGIIRTSASGNEGRSFEDRIRKPEEHLRLQLPELLERLDS